MRTRRTGASGPAWQAKGVKVEINFTAEEARAEGVYADLKATELE